MCIIINIEKKLEINVIQNKNQILCKKHGCFLTMADIDNHKLMGLLIIAEGSLLLSQEHIKENGKGRKWVRPRMRKRDSKGACYSIINDLSLTNTDDFRKYLQMNRLAAIPIFLGHGIQKAKQYILHKSSFIVFNSKKIISV